MLGEVRDLPRVAWPNDRTGSLLEFRALSWPWLTTRFPALLWSNLNTGDTCSQSLSPFTSSGLWICPAPLGFLHEERKPLARLVCFPLSPCSGLLGSGLTTVLVGGSDCWDALRKKDALGQLRKSCQVTGVAETQPLGHHESKCWMVHWPAYHSFNKPCWIKYASARNQLNPPEP